MTTVSDDVTRNYLEIQPATDPTNIGYYKNVINTRQFTLANITQLCKVSSEVSYNGWIGYILESSIRKNDFEFKNSESMVGKAIFQVEYLYDVWVTRWTLICALDKAWDAEFKWQASHDKKTWVDISVKQKSTKEALAGSMMSSENDVEWQFLNPIRPKGSTKYKYWRVYGLSGNINYENGGLEKDSKTTNGHINCMFMNII